MCYGWDACPSNTDIRDYLKIDIYMRKKTRVWLDYLIFLTGLFDFLSGLLNFLTRVFDFLAVFFIFGLDYLNFDLVNNLNRAAFAMVPAAFPAFKAGMAIFHHVCVPRKIYNVFHHAAAFQKYIMYSTVFAAFQKCIIYSTVFAAFEKEKLSDDWWPMSLYTLCAWTMMAQESHTHLFPCPVVHKGNVWKSMLCLTTK